MLIQCVFIVLIYNHEKILESVRVSFSLFQLHPRDRPTNCSTQIFDELHFLMHNSVTFTSYGIYLVNSLRSIAYPLSCLCSELMRVRARGSINHSFSVVDCSSYGSFWWNRMKPYRFPPHSFEETINYWLAAFVL